MVYVVCHEASLSVWWTKLNQIVVHLFKQHGATHSTNWQFLLPGRSCCWEVILLVLTMMVALEIDVIFFLSSFNAEFSYSTLPFYPEIFREKMLATEQLHRMRRLLLLFKKVSLVREHHSCYLLPNLFFALFTFQFFRSVHVLSVHCFIF